MYTTVFQIQQSWIIIVLLLSDLCACIRMNKKNEAIALQWPVRTPRFERLVRLQSCEKAMGWCTAQCKMLPFCVETIVKESCNFVLAHLKKKKRKKKNNVLTIHENTTFKTFKITDSERFLYYHILRVCTIPTCRVYWLYNYQYAPLSAIFSTLIISYNFGTSRMHSAMFHIILCLCWIWQLMVLCQWF